MVYVHPSNENVNFGLIRLADITAVCAFSVVEVAFASAVITGDFKDVMAEFHMGNVVVALTVTLMVCGFGIGPLFWSPMVRCIAFTVR